MRQRITDKQARRTDDGEMIVVRMIGLGLGALLAATPAAAQTLWENIEAGISPDYHLNGIGIVAITRLSDERHRVARLHVAKNVLPPTSVRISPAFADNVEDFPTCG